MGENEQNTCDADERILHVFREEKDKETRSQQARAREMGFLISQEEWVLADEETFGFVKEKSVSKIEFRIVLGRFVLHERRQVVVTLNEGVMRVCVYRLPRNEEEERIIQYMLTLLSEGRETDKGIIDKLLPSFKRCFEFVQYLVDYRKNNKKMPYSALDVYQLVMATLTQQETDNIENLNSP